MDRVKHTVDVVVKQAGTRDPYRIAELLGVKVDEFPFAKVRGMLITLGGETVVVLNAHLSPIWKRAVLAHELGHLYMSPAGSYLFVIECTQMGRLLEREACRFAAELLLGGMMPEPGETAEEFAARADVPAELLQYWRNRLVS